MNLVPMNVVSSRQLFYRFLLVGTLLNVSPFFPLRLPCGGAVLHKSKDPTAMGVARGRILEEITVNRTFYLAFDIISVIFSIIINPFVSMNRLSSFNELFCSERKTVRQILIFTFLTAISPTYCMSSQDTENTMLLLFLSFTFLSDFQSFSQLYL